MRTIIEGIAYVVGAAGAGYSLAPLIDLFQGLNEAADVLSTALGG